MGGATSHSHCTKVVTTLGSNMCICLCIWVHIIVSKWACLLYMFMTPFASHIWCLDHLDGLTHLSCISRLTKMSKMTNTFYVLLMEEVGTVTIVATEMGRRTSLTFSDGLAHCYQCKAVRVA